MRGSRPVLLVALLLLLGCGGKDAVPIASNPAERIGPPTARPDTGHASQQDKAPRAETIASGDQGISDEDLEADGGPPDRADEEAPAETPDQDADEAVYHILRHGQTLYSVAKMYGVRLHTLLEANGIADPTKVPADTPILIPGFRRGHEQAVEPGGSAQHLAWPLHGAITGAFGPRGRHSHHAGIDIDGDGGDPIRAAASGTVLKAGIDGRYGRRIVLEHGDGLFTLYAHASKLLVREGDQVRVGQEIAAVGRSGNAHGTHLHFEVRRDGRAVNPIPYLKTSDLQASLAGSGVRSTAAKKKTTRVKPVSQSMTGAQHSGTHQSGTDH
jgi:murein DD-endopeptidase MepM/ murein hydrolase activator NlpD